MHLKIKNDLSYHFRELLRVLGRTKSDPGDFWSISEVHIGSVNVTFAANCKPHVNAIEFAVGRRHFDDAIRCKNSFLTLVKRHVVPGKTILVVKHQRLRYKLLASDRAVEESDHGAAQPIVTRGRVTVIAMGKDRRHGVEEGGDLCGGGGSGEVLHEDAVLGEI